MGKMDNVIGTVATFTTKVGIRSRVTIPPEAIEIANLQPKDIIKVRIEKIKQRETNGEKS